jgi:hypothetical protein
LLYAVVFLITFKVGQIVGAILFFGLMGVCIWGAFSHRQFVQMQGRYPSLHRSEYIANMAIFPVGLPLVIFVVLLILQKLPY